jgi:DNA modification methylase
MEIKDLILKTEKVDWQELKDLQPVDLKNNYHAEKLKKSLVANGFASSIYVWKDKKGGIYIIDGHHRADVLRELKSEGYDIPDKLNCTFLDLPDKKTAVKYLLQVFNQKTNPINEDNLNIWLDNEFSIDLDDLKIDVDDLHIDLGDEEEDEAEEQEEVKEDEVPEVKHNFVVKGDLWELEDVKEGLKHRVLCGDSTMIDDVEKVMNGEKVENIYTDPPYGINEEGDRSGRGGLTKGNKLLSFKDDTNKYAIDCYNLNRAFKFKNEVWWGANYYCHSLPMTNNWVIWDKRLEEKQRDYNSDAELAWVKSSQSSCRIFRHLWKGLIKGSEHGQKRVHPTQKPIQLAADIFDYYKFSDSVIDFFLGSGSTLIACQQTKRNCYGIELDEHYCGVTIVRWLNLMLEEKKDFTVKRNGGIVDIKEILEEDGKSDR